MNMQNQLPKVLAISSGGGHWIQLMRLCPAFEKCDVSYATVEKGYLVDLPEGTDFYVIGNSNRWSKIAMLRTAIEVLLLLLRLRPDIIITTGAAPGYFAICFGKWLGARVVWLDSLANAQELSLSGKKAGKFADLWLTQWPHLAKEKGPTFLGGVI